MSRTESTFIGEVKSVSGGVVSIQLRDDLSSSLVLVDGESYRLGQIGAFLRIPLGYQQLYGVCTQVGAAAVPANTNLDIERSNRWISLTLFGEALGNQFERGVSQYPTVGDEVHLVTTRDLEIIYGSVETTATIAVGTVAASSGITAQLDLGKLVGRHCAVVGSTGAGKSNLAAVLLEAIATQGYPSARILVIDPHGEYPSCVGSNGYIFKANAQNKNEKPLYVPFWALPFEELQRIGFGEMSLSAESGVRDEITDRKRKSAKSLNRPPSPEVLTADSPVPFNLKQLWFDLDDYERHVLQDKTTVKRAKLIQTGNADELKPNQYPAAGLGSSAPFLGPRRGIARQLDLLRSRLQDARFRFLFSPGSQLTPHADGTSDGDLDTLVASWVGHERPITVLDVSGLPSEVMGAIVGTLLRIVYDTLFWAGDSPISGRNQPLLIVLEEAHLFLPDGGDSIAHRTVTRIAKEGRKYGVGLLVVTQRPTEVDSTVLSQCGTMISLRLSSSGDRARVAATMPDDLGNLVAMLPSLRTGEGLVIGESLPIPSRILFRRAMNKPIGDDPDLAESWRRQDRPNPEGYAIAVSNWRNQSFASDAEGEPQDG